MMFVNRMQVGRYGYHFVLIHVDAKNPVRMHQRAGKNQCELCGRVCLAIDMKLSPRK